MNYKVVFYFMRNIDNDSADVTHAFNSLPQHVTSTPSVCFVTMPLNHNFLWCFHTDSCHLRTPYRTLPAWWIPAVRQTPSAEVTVQSRQTSRSVEPLRSFGKLQEEKPMDVPQRVQRESVVSENVLSQKH